MKNLFLILVVLTCGCATNRTLFKDNQAQFIKPPLPSQLELRKIDWRFFNANSNVSWSRDPDCYAS